MTVQSRLLYSQVLGAGLPFWRLELSNWGNRGAGADANSLQYQGRIDAGAAAIVIGPESTADEAVIRYNQGIGAPTAQAIFPGAVDQEELTIGVKKPGINLPGPLQVGTTFTTQFTDGYFRDGDPTGFPFGTLEPRFEAPTLQLLFYPRPPTNVAYKRNDMYRSSRIAADGAIGTETLIAIWPVMGRACKSIYFRATGNLVATVRVGGIVDFVTTVLGLPQARVIEKTVNNVTLTVNATTGATAQCTTGRPMQWIAAYYTRVSGDGNIETNLIAEDC